MSTALHWLKSSYSSNEGGNCIEVATQPSAVHIRDSKNTGPTLRVAPGTWAAFLGLARRDEVK
ncbi:DUF397 domain-containing protein [Streptomyces canus]|uniref:DUF397 domain-containing protein n=1 Tax=Streptomyces canus TaxID=58343 RepID=A0AAW8FDU7_9ACTN|nr:DUF397 domain-containing protein [Streptomyces canus]MDQ0764118.1 hypothetical protein [Streptomyces canus]MDQ0907421.1 hypothetical protein [Streptomyces canus]